MTRGWRWQSWWRCRITVRWRQWWGQCWWRCWWRWWSLTTGHGEADGNEGKVWIMMMMTMQDDDDDDVAWGEGVANIIIPRRGADTNRVEAAAAQPGAIDISQQRELSHLISGKHLVSYKSVSSAHTSYLFPFSPIHRWRKIGHVEKLQISIHDRCGEIWNFSTCRSISDFPHNRCGEMWNLPNLEEYHISPHSRCEECESYPVFCCKICFVAI